MPIEEQRFTDINGAEHLLSEKMDSLKEWIVSQEYEGLTTVNDFTEGSMNYFLLCYAASMAFDLELQADELIRHGFLNTSKGDFLERLAARNGIYRVEGVYSTTELLLTIPAPVTFDVVIEAGTEFGTDDTILFNLTEDVIIPSGALSIHGVVQCQEQGIIGNVKAGTIVNVFSDLNVELSCYNESDVTNGLDAESDESLRERATTQGVGTDLWLENVAKTLAADAVCYTVEENHKLIIFKPTPNIGLEDMESLFTEKMYRTRNIVLLEEATPHNVIDETMNIHLVLRPGFIPETVKNIIKQRIGEYVDKIRIGDLFKPVCIKYLCESTEGVLYAELTGYDEIDLTNSQYAVIDGEVQVTTDV